MKEKGYIEGKHLSEKAIFCVRSGMPPLNYEEFLKRKYLGLEEVIYIRPLLFTEKFDGLYDFVKKGETFTEDDVYVKEKLITCGKSCYEDNTHQFLFYIEGLTFKYKNIQNPPGEFSYLGTDVLHLLRTMIEIRKIGDLELSTKDMLKIAHSIKYGITLDYSALGGLKGIGHIRANLLKRTLYREGINPPKIGTPTEEFIESLLDYSESEKALQDTLTEILVQDRFRDDTHKEQAERETKYVLKVLLRSKKGFLVDDRILITFGLFLLGDRAIKIKKIELLEEILSYEEVGF